MDLEDHLRAVVIWMTLVKLLGSVMKIVPPMVAMTLPTPPVSTVPPRPRRRPRSEGRRADAEAGGADIGGEEQPAESRQDRARHIG